MNSEDMVLSDAKQIELSRCIRSATISQREGRRARVRRFQELRLRGLVDLPGRGCTPSLPTEPLSKSLSLVSANLAGAVEAWLKSTVFHRPASSGYGPPMT